MDFQLELTQLRQQSRPLQEPVTIRGKRKMVRFTTRDVLLRSDVLTALPGTHADKARYVGYMCRSDGGYFVRGVYKTNLNIQFGSGDRRLFSTDASLDYNDRFGL